MTSMENSNKEITLGMIVLYNGGWCKVTRVTKNTVNLGAVFGKTIYHKGVNKSEVVEDHDNWYKAWSRSESYQCM